MEKLEMKVNEFKWRVIPHTVGSAPWQMAVDHALLQVMNESLEKDEEVSPVVRTYGFDKGAVILGYMQSGKRFGKVKSNGHYLTTRISGGGHMYFSPEDVHFSAIVPLKLLPENLIESYRLINNPIVASLKEMGYKAKLGRTSVKIDLEEEKTLVGTAQYKMGKAMLQHGSVLVHNYNEEIFDFLSASEKERRVWKDKVVTLGMLNGEANMERLAELIILKFVGRGFVGSELKLKERNLARKYQEEIYDNTEMMGKGSRHKDLCLLEGLMAKDYEKHLRENSSLENG